MDVDEHVLDVLDLVALMDAVATVVPADAVVSRRETHRVPAGIVRHMTTGLDVANFVVSALGTAATVVLAIVGVVLTRRANDFAESRAERDEQRVLREARAEYGQEFLVWVREGMSHPVMAGELVYVSPDWDATRDRLRASATVLGVPGATDLLDLNTVMRESWERADDDRQRALLKALQGYLLGLHVASWVEDPVAAEPQIKQQVIEIRAAGADLAE